MIIGDPVLIYRSMNFEYFVFVTFKLHSRPLAEHLWGTNIHQETWEYVYFLDKLTDVSIPLRTFNKLLGYSDNFIPQGFAGISQERIQLLQNKFGSVDNFLNYLAEDKWVEAQPEYPKKIRQQIVTERISKHVGKTELLEANLENFLAERVDQIEPGLTLLDR